jgi:hypothetical protein
MTSKEFATLYSGRKIKWTEEGAREMYVTRLTKTLWDHNKPIGVAIGHTINGVAYSPTLEFSGIWEKIHESYYGIFHDSYSSFKATHEIGKTVNYYRISPLYRLVIPEIKINPYPHVCKKCHSPARKGSNVIFCSNVKCKSRKTVVQRYRVSMGLGKTADDPIVVKCLRCDVKAGSVWHDGHGHGTIMCFNHSQAWTSTREFVIGLWYEYSWGILQCIENGWKVAVK